MGSEEKDVLFEIRKENLDSGLRGVPIGTCVTSSVDPVKGLFYADKPIRELVSWEPEKVIFLLYRGYEGTAEEIAAFKRELRKRATLSSRVKEQIERLPREGHPMKLFPAALLLLGMLEGTGDYREDCLNLIAKVPELTATVINSHGGFGATGRSDPELGYMENFAHLLNVPGKEDPQFAEVMRLFNILHYDHGGGNLSTFVGKAIASGLEDLYGSLAGAMNALAGPRHGRANQECLAFVQEAFEALGESATLQQVEEFIRLKLKKGELIYGFGHAVLRVEDPRATVQYAFMERHYPDHPLVRIALLLRSAGAKVLKENPKVTNPYPNVDAVSGTLLTAAGFPYPEYYTLLFGMARSVGIAIQIVYERLEAREGKGTPIIRPKYIYKSRAKSSSAASPR